ncbi:LytTr DNA-binding domain-containing protein [Spirosomataceae bacterium TFI 002]|nr:LytTr DNA-binding domain-containing protein [Spirosomataceae bacterium TFI 002]
MKTLSYTVKANKFSVNPVKPLLHVGSGKRLSTDEIVMLEAKANYTEVSLISGSKLTVSTNLGVIEERLVDYENYIRPNRQFIVNLDFFEKINADYLFVKGREIKVSRRRKSEVKQQLQVLNQKP